MQTAQPCPVRAEPRPGLEQLRARRAEEEERYGTESAGQEFDEGEEAVVGPVQVLDDEHEWRFTRQSLEEAQPSREVLLAFGIRRFEADECAKAVQQPSMIGGVGHDGRKLVRDRRRAIAVEDAGVSLDDLGEGPVWRALAERRTAALTPGDHLWARVHLGEELLHEACLAYAWFTDHEDGACCATRHDTVEEGAQLRRLFATTDERRELPVPSNSTRAGDRSHRSPSRDQLCLALGGDRRQFLEDDDPLCELVRERADGDAHRRGGGLRGGRRCSRRRR